MAHSGKVRNISVKNSSLPLILTSRSDDKLEPTATQAQHMQALKMARAMQSTLDVYTLIQRFYKELEQQLPIKSLHYQNNETDHKINIGNAHKHAITYKISTEDASLGELTFTLANQCTENENIILENALSNIVYPLRNALLYHIAVVNSNTDPLTKLGNRSGFDSALDREINFAIRHSAALSLIVLDVDNFKSINDTHGHRTGDCLLIEVAKVLESVCRTSDMIFRYGGDEFIIILSHTPKIGAQNLAERIREEINSINTDFIKGNPSLSASLGLACLKQNDNAITLFERADKALYDAKKGGRNKSCIAD